jgi:hypothetical protein
LAAKVEDPLELLGCGRVAEGLCCVFVDGVFVDGVFIGCVFEGENDCACDVDTSHATLTTPDNKTEINLFLGLLTTALPSLSVSKFRSHVGDVAKIFSSMQ